MARVGRILTLPPTPSPARSGGEGRGEEELRRNHWQAEIKSPSPQPSPRASLRGEGVNYRGSGKMRPQTSQTPSAFDLFCPSAVLCGMRLSRSKSLDLNVAKANRIVVPGKTEVAARAVFARMRMVRHELSHVRQVGVGNHGAVQFH